MYKYIRWTAVAGALSALGYRMWKIETPQIDMTPDPAHTYEDSLARLAQLLDRDDDRVNPACRTRLLTHGQRTPHAVALLHGLSNCPQQFAQFADALFAAGYNVLLPRLPRHGLERLSDDLAGLTTEEMLNSTAEFADILRGLGDHVTILGLSAGGALAAWCAQNRPDVDRVMAISPALGLAASPKWADRIYANLLRTLPNVYVWWNPKLKADAPGPPDAYPRIPTRAIGALIRLGKSIQIQAGSGHPVVDDVRFILNPNDVVVRNDTTKEVAALWRQRGINVDLFEFSKAWELPHDLIDPGQVEQQVDVVYPVLAALMLNGRA